MYLYGSHPHSSPSEFTKYGQEVLKKMPDTLGSLGISISEVIHYTLEDGGKYMAGSVINSDILFMKVAGMEARKQMKMAGEGLDYTIGAVEGGSYYGVLAFTFLADELVSGNIKRTYIISGSKEVPKMTECEYRYDFPDTCKILQLLKMYTIGYDFIFPAVYADDLRCHAIAQTLTLLMQKGIVSARDYDHEEAFKWAKLFSKT